MSNSNEKLVTGLMALLPVARDAFKNGHLNRQFDAVLSNGKVRNAGSQIAGQAERYVRDTIKGNKFARQVAARMAPKPSPLPAIALAALGAGLVLVYLDRRKAKKLSADLPNGQDSSDMSRSGLTLDVKPMSSL